MVKSTYILGISAFYHDSAACLVHNGIIIAAAQEERFTRIKHDSSYPTNAIAYCLSTSGIQTSELDFVAFYDKPFLKFERILQTFAHETPRGWRSFMTAMPAWLKHKLWLKDQLRRKLNYSGTILFPEHHESHAASAFFPSPFKTAAFLTVDGVGEWATTSYGIGNDNKIAISGELLYPHSLGLLYSAFTYYLGFKVNSGEYKVMGLAPYGEPKYVSTIFDNLVDLKPDGSFKLNLKYFNYLSGLTMTNGKFDQLFGGSPRRPETPLTQRHMDIAASIQKATEEIMVRIVRYVHSETGMDNLCLAGGVALNCVANARLIKETPFKDIWIQPAAGDAGGALGAALFTWHQFLDNSRQPARPDSQQGSLLGPAYSAIDIQAFLNQNHLPFHKYDDETSLVDEVALQIKNQKVIGWFQGRMEFGPRALGNRSILGDAQSSQMQRVLNLKIKFRESFRPFAPAVMFEHAYEYFDLDRPSPYMLLVAPVTNNRRCNVNSTTVGLARLDEIRSDIPAVTHLDFSARVQTVHVETNPLFHKLLGRLYDRYHCPVVINTSFNVRGEPIVCTPADAYRCFMRTQMDYLVLGNYILVKSEQPALRETATQEFEAD